MTRRSVILGWVLTRLVTFLLFLAFEGARGVAGDVNYFADALADVPDVGLSHTLVEYPLPAVAVVVAPLLLALLVGSAELYAVMLVLSALTADAVFTGLLHRASARGDRAPVGVWLLAFPLLGSISIARFDLLVGILAGLAMLAVSVRPRASAALLSVATAVKLWPVLLLPGVVLSARRRLPVLAVVAGIGAVAVAGTLLASDWARLVSPLAYQSDRGLQVEAVLASPVMTAWALDPGGWAVAYAGSRSFEVTGPGATALLTGTTVLTVLLLLGLVLLLWRVVRRAEPLSAEGVVWLSLVVTTGFLVSAKVLSPQYLLWVLPLAAAGLTFVRTRALAQWSVGLLVAAGASHVVYPLLYRGLVEHTWETPLVLTVLVGRNLLLVGLLVVAARRAWIATAATSRP